MELASGVPRTPPVSAKGSSFYAAMRVLPRTQRQAMFAIYAFCRAVDDIADGMESRDERLGEIARWRTDIAELYAGTPATRVLDLVEPIRRFGLRRQDFLSILEGVEMDVETDIVAPDSATLDAYCDRVACAVGRLSVRVFGMPEPDGINLALRLGRALQLTNILRDLDEDAAKGRLYLPRELLLDAGIERCSPPAVLAHPALSDVCRAVASRARCDFDEADGILSQYPLRIVRSPLLMASAYRYILERLVAQGWAPPRRRIRIGRLRKLWMVVRYGFGW
jgi:presqualene diphosphate synthase